MPRVVAEDVAGLEEARRDVQEGGGFVGAEEGGDVED